MPEATRFDAELLRLLQLDDGLTRSIDDALERGFEVYRERGWV